jgi:uncharacterized protein YdbL (DUF1318 family)
MLTRWHFLAAAAAVVATAPAAAQAQNAITNAIQAGYVGERFDGYMGFATTPSPEVRRQVNAINLRRRNLYIELASRRSVTADIVGLSTACELFSQLRVGQAYMLRDGAWRRVAAGQRAPLPDQCR